VTPSITLSAFAKINWSLRVIGKRADGYHEIDTVLQTISLHDTLTFQVTDDPQIVLSCDDRSIASDEPNLAWRAAEAVQSRFRVAQGVKIRLEKRIPARAGLGGGSSDAAATLLGLAHLWRIEIAKDDLLELAANLGTDVAFFLYGGAAWGRGRGNTLAALEDTPDTYFVVLKPKASVSTSKAYEALNSPALTTSDSKIILSSSRADDFSDKVNPDILHNDFEAVAFKLEPEIERTKVALAKAGAKATLLAGSGSAVFGIFDNKDAQERAIQAIELETGWRAFPCKTVGRRQYRSAMGPAGEILARCFGADGANNAGA
jgi:4-diphosphocytidyl-2-C-methyl-D-erythritol kinase